MCERSSYGGNMRVPVTHTKGWGEIMTLPTLQLLLFYLASQAQCNVAVFSWIYNLHLKVVTSGTQGLSSLCKTHINYALSLPHIFQELQRKDDTAKITLSQTKQGFGLCSVLQSDHYHRSVLS